MPRFAWPNIGRSCSDPCSCWSCCLHAAASTACWRERAVADALLEIEELTKRFGGVIASDSISLCVPKGELHAIIGPNGAGKTTLIGQLAGEIAPDAGRIRFEGGDVTALSVDRRSQLGVARREPELRTPARTALARAGLGAREDVIVSNLSHGEHRQLEIAMALATTPRMLLLDEPMAGMGPDESARMVKTLRELKRELTILLIEHDMEAVFALADRITVLVYGRIIASGTPEAIRANAEVRQAYLGEQEQRHG